MKRVKRPCSACPWRKDCEPERFDPERWASLTASSIDPETGFGPEFGGPLFACHKTPEGGERACAGWLAVEGINHPTVRLGLLTGAVPVCSIEPGEGWPELHDSFAETMTHDMNGREPFDG